jgi:hypothetical protein
VAGTISLTSGQLAITDSLTITGPSQYDLSIEAEGISRLFNFTAPGAASLSIVPFLMTNNAQRRVALEGWKVGRKARQSAGRA